jgi:hypothetical protein
MIQSRAQQEARLRELRLDPYFQQPWKDGEIPVRFEGGATMEDAWFTGVGNRTTGQTSIMKPTDLARSAPNRAWRRQGRL